MSESGKTLRTLINERRGILVPGAANALAARLIEDLGFEVAYITGAGVTNTYLGLPDLGFVGLHEMASHAATIRNVVDIPLIVDADTGFGNAVNVYQTVRVLERSGANAIQIEDQRMPKKCGHFNGKQLVGTDEMVAKIKSALDARHSDDFLVMARTDARATEGFQAAIDRCHAFEEAGADIIFLEAPESADELRSLPGHIRAPQLVNMVVGGRTPALSNAEFAELGFSLVLYANVALQSALAGMTRALTALKAGEVMDNGGEMLASFAQRQSVVRKDFYDDLDERFS